MRSLFRTVLMVMLSTALLGIAGAYYPYNTPVPDNQELYLEVFSTAGVNCGNPPASSTFTINEDRQFAMLATYHWCDGASPGTILDCPPDSRQLVKQRYLKQTPLRTALEIYSQELNAASSCCTPYQ